MRQTLKDAFEIAWKDLADFFRDRMRLISFIIMPIFMMVMTGYIFPSQNSLNGVSIAVVNGDGGGAAASRVAAGLEQIEIGGTKSFNLLSASSADEAKDLIRQGRISGAIVIPAGFTQGIMSGKQAQVTIITDQSNPQVSAMLGTMLEKVVDAFSTKVAEEKLRAVTAMAPVPLLGDPDAAVRPFVVRQEGIVAGEPNYFQFMAPGIMAMVVVMAVMMGLAGAIAREREIGTLDGILVAPINRLSIILGKTFSQSVRGFTQGALVLVLAVLLFHVRVYGSLLLVALLLVLGIFSFVGLGILISAFASEQETAMTILMTLNFPMMFLSGAFFPVQQMPEIMRWLSRLIPLSYTIQGLRKVMILGAGLGAITTEIAVLAGFGLVTLAIAVPAFSKAITR